MICRHAQSGDVVHAGAYFGDFLPALETGTPDGTMIWAFEPSEENFRCSQITVLINNLQRVRLFNAALGTTRGYARLVQADATGWPLGSGSYIDQESQASDPGSSCVEVLALDSLLDPSRTVSVIHLDTEGFELSALEGAIETIGTHRPILILEKWNEAGIEDQPWFRQHILESGYELIEEIEGNLVFRYTGGR
jgi:FkbM family methyltransferase